MPALGGRASGRGGFSFKTIILFSKILSHYTPFTAPRGTAPRPSSQIAVVKAKAAPNIQYKQGKSTNPKPLRPQTQSPEQIYITFIKAPQRLFMETSLLGTFRPLPFPGINSLGWIQLKIAKAININRPSKIYKNASWDRMYPSNPWMYSTTRTTDLIMMSALTM